MPEDGLLIYITLGPRRSWLWEDVSQAPFSLCIGSKPHGLSITDENSGGTVARLARGGLQSPAQGSLTSKPGLLGIMPSSHPGPCSDVISHRGSPDLGGSLGGTARGTRQEDVSIVGAGCSCGDPPRHREAGTLSGLQEGEGFQGSLFLEAWRKACS